MTSSLRLPQHNRRIARFDHLGMARRQIRVGQTVNQQHGNLRGSDGGSWIGSSEVDSVTELLVFDGGKEGGAQQRFP